MTRRYLEMWFDLTPEGLIVARPESFRFCLQGCTEGNITLIRGDVGREARRKLAELIDKESPLSFPDSEPLYWECYEAILSLESPIEERPDVSLAYWIPQDFSYSHDVRLLTSASKAANHVVTDPDVIAEVSDWWKLTEIRAPWCIALADSKIASIVETVNFGGSAIECGVKTAPHFRRKGYASAAIAGWFSLANKQYGLCFYSTDIGNTASQSLARQLGLQFLGPTFRLR